MKQRESLEEFIKKISSTGRVARWKERQTELLEEIYHNTLKLNPKYLFNSGREGIIAFRIIFNPFSYLMFTSARNTEVLNRRK